MVAPTVQFAQVQVFPLLDANVLAAHVHEVEVPPVLLEYVGQDLHALPSKYCVVVQLSVGGGGDGGGGDGGGGDGGGGCLLYTSDAADE